MSDITVRRAVPADYEAIGELTVSAYVADGYLDDPDGHEYKVILRDTAGRAGDAELLVAVDGTGAVLGSVAIVLAGSRLAEVSREGELEFRMLAVSPDARGRGVGEVLTRAVIERAKEIGVSRIVLSSLIQMYPAHRLYTRLGFQRLPERDWGKTHVSMMAFEMPLA